MLIGCFFFPEILKTTIWMTVWQQGELLGWERRLVQFCFAAAGKSKHSCSVNRHSLTARVQLSSWAFLILHEMRSLLVKPGRWLTPWLYCLVLSTLQCFPIYLPYGQLFSEIQLHEQFVPKNPGREHIIYKVCNQALRSNPLAGWHPSLYLDSLEALRFQVGAVTWTFWS